MSTKSFEGFIIEDFDAPPDHGGLAGVLFAEDFDLDTPPPAPAAAAPPPIGPAELEAARAISFAEGLAAGIAQAEASGQRAEHTALAALAVTLSEARGDAAAVAMSGSASLARGILQALAAAFPELCDRHGPAEAEALAAALLPRLTPQPRLTIRANPHTMPAVQRVATAQPGAADRITLIPTDALAEGDLAIDWQDGSVVRSRAALLADLARALAPLGVDVRNGDSRPAPTHIKELADA